MSTRHRHHGHHRHRHGVWYRLRRYIRHHKKLTAGYAAVAAIVLLVVGTAALRIEQIQDSRHVTSGNSLDMGSGYRNITYKGRKYQYNSLITTVLYAGIDSEGKLAGSRVYSNKARADSVALVVLDKKHKKMSILAMSRDTMTDIRRYSREGSDMGTYVSHLGYAYSYGDGAEVSCESLREAVIHLLGGVPVDEYAVSNQTSMTYINNLVGGVTLEVPNQDLAARYPELQKGVVVTLDDTNIRDYLHYRDIAEDFSNEGRIERQQTYITAYVDQIRQRLHEDLNGVWKDLEQMDDYLQTSITKNKYIGLANLLNQVDFSDADYYRLPGEDRRGELHDEFHVDQEALQQLVIDLFYEEV